VVGWLALTLACWMAHMLWLLVTAEHSHSGEHLSLAKTLAVLMHAVVKFACMGLCMSSAVTSIMTS